MALVLHSWQEDSMPAPGQMTGETGTRRRAMAFMGSLTALLGLSVLGFPLAPVMITRMLLGAIQISVANAVSLGTLSGDAIRGDCRTVRSTDCIAPEAGNRDGKSERSK
jgi:hypothetical protein